MKLYAWIGEDSSGEVGLISVQTALGLSPAVVAKRETAEMLREFAQQRANILDVDVHLVEFESTNTIETISKEQE